MLSCVLIIYFLLVFHWINISQLVYPLFYRLISRLFPNFGCYKSGRSEQSCIRFLCVHVYTYMLVYIDIPHFVALCFIVLQRYFIFTNWRFVATLHWSSISTIFLTAFAYFMHLSDILVIFAIFQTLHQKGSDDSWYFLSRKYFCILAYAFFRHNTIIVPLI